MKALFTQEDICAIVVEHMMALYVVENDEVDLDTEEGICALEVSEWLTDKSGFVNDSLYWIESFYRCDNSYNGRMADAYEIPGLIIEGDSNQEILMKLYVAALEVFNARYIYEKLPSRSYGKKIKFEDYDFRPKYCPNDMSLSDLSAWLNQEGWDIIHDEERYNVIFINSSSDIVFNVPRTINDMVSQSVCQLIFSYVAIDEINKTDPNHVNRVWAQRLGKRMLDRSRSKSKLSSTTGFSRWTCDVCDGDSSTGCLFYDPTECPR